MRQTPHQNQINLLSLLKKKNKLLCDTVKLYMVKNNNLISWVCSSGKKIDIEFEKI
jgi:hypothetical protein